MSRVNYNTYPKSHNYITINYMSPKPTKRAKIRKYTHIPKQSSPAIAGSHESPNAPRPFPCHGPRNLREVEREYNDSVNGHPRA